MKRVLIVEDNLHARNFLKSSLSQLSQNLLFYDAETEDDGLDLAISFNIDIFIVDIGLKKGDGIRFAERLRRYLKYELTTIVFCTAHGAGELYAFRKIHCYQYITKPFTKMEVISTFRPLLRDPDEIKYIKLNNKNVNIQLPVDEIMYVEIVNRKMFLYTKYKESQRVYGRTLEGISQELGEGFLFCRRNVIFNRKYYRSMDKNQKKIVLKFERDEIDLDYTDKFGKKIEREMEYE